MGNWYRYRYRSIVALKSIGIEYRYIDTIVRYYRYVSQSLAVWHQLQLEGDKITTALLVISRMIGEIK